MCAQNLAAIFLVSKADIFYFVCSVLLALCDLSFMKKVGSLSRVLTSGDSQSESMKCVWCYGVRMNAKPAPSKCHRWQWQQVISANFPSPTKLFNSEEACFVTGFRILNLEFCPHSRLKLVVGIALK